MIKWNYKKGEEWGRTRERWEELHKRHIWTHWPTVCTIHSKYYHCKFIHKNKIIKWKKKGNKWTAYNVSSTSSSSQSCATNRNFANCNRNPQLGNHNCDPHFQWIQIQHIDHTLDIGNYIGPHVFWVHNTCTFQSFINVTRL